MKKYLFTMVALAGLILTACSSEEQSLNPESVQGAKELKLATSLAGYTRATDTAFETGDLIGLYMLLPDAYLEADPNVEKAYLDNLCLDVVEGGALACDVNGDLQIDEQDKLFWYTDPSYTADLVAYYPYDVEKGYNHNMLVPMSFCVQADQTTWESYTASDFMVAHLQSAPTEQALTLPFKHQLSKVVVTVNNELGEEISDLWFSDVYGRVKYDITNPQQVETNGLKGMIRAYREPTRATETFRLILAPQENVAPKLIVTTVSEKQYTFTLEQAVSFASGKQYNATITLNAESTSTEFAPEIIDWIAYEQFYFQPRESLWGVVGSFNDWGSGESDVMMTEEEEGLFVAMVQLAGETEFKIRYDHKWDKNRGLKSGSEVELGNRYDVVQGGANFKFSYTGTCLIYYDAKLEQITLRALR